MTLLRQKLDSILEDYSVYDILYELSQMYREQGASEPYPAMRGDVQEDSTNKARILENAITEMEQIDTEET